MAAFVYEARTVSREIRKGEIEAPSLEEAKKILRAQKLIVTSIKKKATAIEIKIPGLGEKIEDKDIVVFTRQFATMIEAGLPLVQCLEILAAQSEKKPLRDILSVVKEDVESGSTFADALRKHPKVFDNLFTNMVEAGETGGILDNVLKRLASYIEKAQALKSKVKKASVYPIAILSVAFVVVAALLIFVIPTFAKMFSDFGGELPPTTQMVINMSHFAASWRGVAVFFGIVALIIAFKYYRGTKSGRLVTDRIFLKLPIFGDIIKKSAVAKFSRTLSTLITSGVPILEGLDIVSRTSGNVVIGNAILETKQSIAEGKTIAEPLEKTDVFPAMVVQMIGVGEATGALDSMLAKIADFYEEEVDNAVEALTSLMEPALMVVLGGIVGFILVAMYLPIFTLATAIQ
ncbi:MAG: type II secretion system F family protein [Candidatus Schekmanbacteria bacterium]|nr:MAG: type II secretion system F family protein [Candidatus Schekmanbacteria bacterium]